MSLKPCKECGREVSTKADKCPNCGAPIPKENGFLSGCLGVVGLLALGFVLILVFANGGKEKEIDKTSPPKVTTPKDLPSPAQIEKEKQEKEKQKQAEAKRIAERDAQKRAQREKATKENLNAFTGVLEKAGIDSSIIVNISVGGSGSGSNIATIKVTNAWHIQPYQIRLQGAQNLWKIWANISSPLKPDIARIILVDLNDNKVGGSRLLGGSLIWVQE